MEEAERLEENLTDFVRAGWSQIDSSQYQDSWAIDALCDHLTGVADGHIKRLLINFPPRCGKTKVASICFPAWTWARREKSFTSGPGVRFFCGSYNHDLSLQNSNQTRRMILGPWYQRRWGNRFRLQQDQNTKTQFDNTKGGSRLAASVGGSLLGVGGDIILIDDPHNTEEVESEADRETATTWWKEVRSTRLNDPKQSALVVIMQRLHEEDVSGQISAGEDYSDWTHLMLPMRHDPDRHCVTVLKWDGDEPAEEWEDPRTEDGELMWPERFGEKEVAGMERDLGPYMASGRLQQSPVPKGGTILKREYWQLWGEEKYPPLEFVLASADTAYTEKEENDPTGFTVWGIYRDRQERPRALLLWAWAKHCELLAKPLERLPDETKKDFDKRSMPTWGVVEWIAYSCRRFKVDRLLIENKASGKSVAQAIQNLYSEDSWGVQLVDPAKDKVARAWTVEPLLAAGLVYAPHEDGAPWVEKVLQQCEVFPKGKHDDLVDSVSMALKFMKDNGLIAHNFETAAELRDAMEFRPEPKALYDV